VNQKAEMEREKARECAEKREESFERCDTDGFLSQWALGLDSQKHNLQARIEEADGTWCFEGLFDGQGRRVKAKLVTVADSYSYGNSTKEIWLLLDERDEKIAWVPRAGNFEWTENLWRDEGPVEVVHPAQSPSKQSKMFKLGLHEEEETATAKAAIKGSGYGLSGNAWAVVIRTDGGYPDGAIVYEGDVS
jgi:hypothetical protein